MDFFKGLHVLVCANLLAPTCGYDQGGDATVLLQSQLAQPSGDTIGEPTDLEFWRSATNTTPRTLYRLQVTRTNGDTHFCATELSFEDEFGQKLQPQFEWMSTCYGCALDCNGCKTEYGNASVLFDGEFDGNDSKWTCSEHGSFSESNGYGRESVIFSVPGKVRKFGVTVNHTGLWMPKDWRIQERLTDRDVWSTIGRVSDASDYKTLWATVEEGHPLGTNYPEAWHVCQGGALRPIVFPHDSVVPLNITLRSQDGRSLINNGRGAQVEGDFGYLTYAGTNHLIEQVRWRVPSQLHLPNGEKASGEMHILCVSPSGKLLEVDLLLQLPLETDSLDTETEHYFLDLGLAAIPEEGDPRPLSETLSGVFGLDVFSAYLQSGFVEMPCDARPDVTWLVLAKPAMVSGVIIEAFRSLFPDPVAWYEAASAQQGDDSSGSNLQAGLTSWEMMAYAVGEWGDVGFDDQACTSGYTWSARRRGYFSYCVTGECCPWSEGYDVEDKRVYYNGCCVAVDNTTITADVVDASRRRVVKTAIATNSVLTSATAG